MVATTERFAITTSALAGAVWFGTFSWMSRGGSWLPIAVLGPVLAAILVARDPGTRTLLRPRPRWLAWGLGAVVGLVAFTHAAHALTIALFPEAAAWAADLYRLLDVSADGPPARIVAVLLVAASEEIIFRGALLGQTDRARAWRMLVLSTLAIAATHVPVANPLMVLLTLVFGGAWGALRIVTGSLVPSVIAHVGWNLLCMFVWPLGR